MSVNVVVGVFLVFVLLPRFIFVVCVVGERDGVDDVLCEHELCLVDLEGRHVLAVVGLSLFLFVVEKFTTFSALVSRFLAIAAGLSGAVTQGRPVGFSLSFLAAFLALSCPFSLGQALAFRVTLVVAFGFLSSAFTLVTFVSPSAVVGRGKVVGDGRFCRRFH